MKLYVILILLSINLNSLEIVVGFQKGGGTDRMARVIASFLKSELKEEIIIKNINGKGSELAAKYVLEQPLNKTVLFASTFAPYLSNTVLTGNSNYKIDDFSMINLQWFDYDLVAVNKDSNYSSLIELFEDLKTSKKQLKVGVNYKSSGHLLLKLLLNKFNIPTVNIEIKTYVGGKFSREALLKKKVDFIIVPANGSELLKNRIKPLAVSKSNRTKRWDAPTINEVLKPISFNIPLIKGSIRGFAVSSNFKKKYPEKYRYLVFIFKKMLASKKVQYELKQNHIGYLWLGNEESNRIIKESHKVLKSYSVLLK